MVGGYTSTPKHGHDPNLNLRDRRQMPINYRAVPHPPSPPSTPPSTPDEDDGTSKQERYKMLLYYFGII